MRVADLDTPALVVDIDIMERNLQRVADYASQHQLRWRPHIKTHKIPELARRQLDLGAAGITAAKTTEAEAMLPASPHDIFIAYPVVGPEKLRRLVGLAGRTNVSVAIDSIEAARGISAAAAEAGATIGILIELDVGLGRVGVVPGESLRQIAIAIAELPGLRFEGLAFYPGHVKRMDDPVSMVTFLAIDDVLQEALDGVAKLGLEAGVVSGGSTPALFQSHQLRCMNEIRPGTYIFNDRNTVLLGACEWQDCAASILATVVSTSVPGRAILDSGSKTLSSDRCALPSAPGFGHMPAAPGAILEKLMEEHGFVDIRNSGRSWHVGEKMHVIPNICVAVNLHEKVYGYRGDEVVEVWEVGARGKLQ